MTRKQQMIAMRKQGHTYEQIARAFNVSRQRVYQLIGVSNKSYFRPITEERCVYPGLRKWMNDNNISTVELTRRLYGSAAGSNQSYVSAWLKGSKTLYKQAIDRILTVTNLTYEEAFKNE